MLKPKVQKLENKKKTNKVDINAIVEEYNNISSQEKLLQNRKKELASIIKEFAVSNGEIDDKGSSYYDTGDFMIGNVAKHSITLDHEKAKELCLEKGIYKDVVKVTESIDEDKFETFVGEGNTISYEELQQVTNIRNSYQVSVKKLKHEEDMPEVEVAASTKKRRTLIKSRK